MNKVILIGRLGSEPEIKNTKSGDPLTTFSMATSKKYKDKNGEKVDQTEWHNCVAFGRLGEVCAEWLHKGSLIAVVGEKSTNTYEKDVSGEMVTMYSTNIKVNEMEMLGGKNDAPPKEDNPSDDW